jgi:hypothetical protein
VSDAHVLQETRAGVENVQKTVESIPQPVPELNRTRPLISYVSISVLIMTGDSLGVTISGSVVDASRGVFNNVAGNQYNLTMVCPQPGQWIRYLIRRSTDLLRDDTYLCWPPIVYCLTEGHTIWIVGVLPFVLMFLVHTRLGIKQPAATLSAGEGPIRCEK